MYLNFIKPLFDRLFSAIALIVFLPVMVIVMLGLFISNKGNPFFFQLRPGLNEKIFRVIKFKTMSDERDSAGNLLADELRLKGIGKFVRKTSLDELPQLINVLKGEMSFVGPRPLLAEYIPLYSSIQNKRHKVKPGITGWAQVNGRNAISWEKKFEYDVWYVDHVSFFIDIKILLRTIVKVFKAEGISSEKSITMEKFKGNE